MRAGTAPRPDVSAEASIERAAAPSNRPDTVQRKKLRSLKTWERRDQPFKVLGRVPRADGGPDQRAPGQRAHDDPRLGEAVAVGLGISGLPGDERGVVAR